MLKLKREMAKAAAGARAHAGARDRRPKHRMEDRYFSRAVSKALEVLGDSEAQILSRRRYINSLPKVGLDEKRFRFFAFYIRWRWQDTSRRLQMGDTRFRLTDVRWIPTSLLTRLLRIARPHLSELTREFQESDGAGRLLF